MEEEYQKFLSLNPVFLEPLADLVLSKQKLGVEFITDFVIRTLNDKYLLVEIEKPQDPIFTQAGDFTANFTHAVGQVLDFQRWVDANGAYAQKLMPLISSPRGLVVIGRSVDMSRERADKLHRFNINSSTIVVLTYDDVLHQSERLLKNILRRDG